ncbi:hypothetical protein T439DRAFT_140478 [Meredithblackwellia eburnea MCA 4105]
MMKWFAPKPGWSGPWKKDWRRRGRGDLGPNSLQGRVERRTKIQKGDEESSAREKSAMIRSIPSATSQEEGGNLRCSLLPTGKSKCTTAFNKFSITPTVTLLSKIESC